MKFANIFAFVVSFYLLGIATASEGKQSSVLLERGTKIPLSGVKVFLLPEGISVETDARGVFSFTQPFSESAELVVNHSGYKRLQIKVNSTQALPKPLYVEKESYQVFETTVTSQKNRRDDAAKTVKQEDFLMVPGAGKDPVKAVQNLPGVNRPTGGASSVIIQGSDPGDTGYTIDGHRVPIIFHFGGLTSVLYPEAVQSVSYLSAGYGPEFSRQLGGYVGLETKSPDKSRAQGQFYLDIFNAGALYEGPLSEDSRILVSGRYSYIGPVLKKVAEKNEDFGLTAAPTYLDLTSIYEKDVDEKNKFKLSFVASRDTFELVVRESPNQDPALRGNFYQRTEFFRLIPQWTHQLDEKREIQFSMGIGRDAIRFDVADNYFDLNTNVLSVRGEYSQQVQNNWKTFVGVDNEYNWFNIGLRLPTIYNEGGVANPIGSGETQEKFLDSKTMVAGIYWRNEWKPTESSRWTLLPHLRYDYFKETKEHHLQPRFGLRYQQDEWTQWRAAAGLYRQEPAPQESDKDFGNEKIKSPQATHTTVGWAKDFRQGSSQGWLLDLGLFNKELTQVIIPDSSEQYSNRGRGQVYGAELLAKWAQDLWAAQVSYTISKSTRYQPSKGTYPSEYDQTHNLNILTSYKFADWTVGGRMRFVTGNPYTPIVGASYDSDNDVYIPQRGSFFSKRRENFFQTDVRMDRKWIYDTWILSAYLDIQNVTNSLNEESVMYSYDYTKSKKVTGLPVLPTFGIKGEF